MNTTEVKGAPLSARVAQAKAIINMLALADHDKLTSQARDEAYKKIDELLTLN